MIVKFSHNVDFHSVLFLVVSKRKESRERLFTINKMRN